MTLHHMPVGRHADYGPKRGGETRIGLLLCLADAVHHVQGVEQLGRHRHDPIYSPPPLFQALEDDDLAG